MEKINIRGVNFLNTTLDGAAEYIWQRFADGEQTAVFTPNSEIGNKLGIHGNVIGVYRKFIHKKLF